MLDTRVHSVDQKESLQSVFFVMKLQSWILWLSSLFGPRQTEQSLVEPKKVLFFSQGSSSVSVILSEWRRGASYNCSFFLKAIQNTNMQIWRQTEIQIQIGLKSFDFLRLAKRSKLQLLLCSQSHPSVWPVRHQRGAGVSFILTISSSSSSPQSWYLAATGGRVKILSTA